jgi:membrane dipeptidase
MKRRSFIFSTAAAMSAAGLSLQSEAAAKRSTTQEQRCIVDGSSDTVPTAEYLQLLKAGGVDVWHYNGPNSLQEFASVLEFIDEHSSEMTLIRTLSDIRDAKRRGAIGLVLGWQSAANLLDVSGNEWRMSNPPRLTLRAYYELGLRIVNLSYNLANQFAGGCLDDEVGLSVSGRYLVGRLQELGILVDCGGHTGERASLEIIKIARRPVICSHSNVAALNDNPRCTSDRVIEGIASTGGVFGVSAIDSFLTWGYKDANKDPIKDVPPQATVSRMVDDIDYLMRLVGPDHIGLGPDFTHAGNVLVDPDDAFQFPRSMTYRQQPIRYVKGFEDVSKIRNVETELRRRGYAEVDIDKIMGGNWLRVYDKAWS